MKMKCAPQPKIVLAFFTMVCAIAATVISSCSPCRAEQAGIAHNPPTKEVSTPAVTTGEEEVSAIDRRGTEEKVVQEKTFGITPHRQNYLLAITYDSHPNVET